MHVRMSVCMPLVAYLHAQNYATVKLTKLVRRPANNTKPSSKLVKRFYATNTHTNIPIASLPCTSPKSLRANARVVGRRVCS